MPPSASLIVRLGIPGLALGVWLLCLLGVQRVLREPRTTARFGAVSALWLSYAALLARSGLLAQSDLVPPPMLLLLAPMLAGSVLFAFSRLGTRLAQDAPLAWLVGLQGFRLPLEIVMHQAAREGVMPEQMTFTGLNFDIVTGCAAIVLCLVLLRRPELHRGWVRAFNLLGSVLLVNVVAIAVASLPSFALFGREPSRLNSWVAYFPYVWLPAALVSTALSGHWLLLRRLRAPGPTGAPARPAAPCSPAARVT